MQIWFGHQKSVFRLTLKKGQQILSVESFIQISIIASRKLSTQANFVITPRISRTIARPNVAEFSKHFLKTTVNEITVNEI